MANTRAGFESAGETPGVGVESAVNTTARLLRLGEGSTKTKAGFETTEFVMMLAFIVAILIATYVADADLGATRAGGTSRGWRPHTS
jgi:hypothetical protein